MKTTVTISIYKGRHPTSATKQTKTTRKPNKTITPDTQTKATATKQNGKLTQRTPPKKQVFES